MSDDLPFEIQVEIIKKLPIKLVIQLRSVSKAWKSVIDSSNFIADYTISNPAQRQHLLIRYENLDYQEIYESIVDDNTFPKNKLSLDLPQSVNLLWHSIVVGTSHGLVCLFGYYYEDDSEYSSGQATAVLWNPSIRKSVAIDVPGVDRQTAFGFGVCPATIDPKIIKINDLHMNRKMRGEACSSLWKVEVYSLSSGVWRSSYCNLSDKLICFKCSSSQAAIGGFFYWFGVGKTIRRGTYFIYLISFDLSSEEFREIYLPNELAFHDSLELHLCKLRDYVVVLREWMTTGIIEVWVMENGDSKLFTKLFTINKPNMSSLPQQFSMNCDLMMTMRDNDEDIKETLIAYKPFLEHMNDLEIESQFCTLSVSSYTESLILLDQPDTLVDDEDDEEIRS